MLANFWLAVTSCDIAASVRTVADYIETSINQNLFCQTGHLRRTGSTVIIAEYDIYFPDFLMVPSQHVM